ncbi:MAG: sel1 repeat family protein [Bdellovibrionales bacterium]|nr:sel1 repeat family protein [Bdellovibrionales bacterium]
MGKLLPVVILILGVVLTVAFRQPMRTEERINLNLIPPPPGIQRFTFGYDEFVADSFWLRLIQDFHICENAKDGIAHAANRKSTEPMCREGWVYKMLEAITDLAPRWKLPYVSGSIMLSVVVDDRDGATKFFEKGLHQFPFDYQLNYGAAYHYLWEEKQPEKAAPLLIRAAQAGGPPWMYSLAGKLYSEEGKLDLAIEVMEQGLKDRKNEKTADRIEKRLTELKARREALKKP